MLELANTEIFRSTRQTETGFETELITMLFCSTLRKSKPQERYPYIRIYYIYIYYTVTKHCFPEKKKHKGVCTFIYTFNAYTILIHIKHNKLMKLPLTLSNLSKIYKKLKLMAHSFK